jgi:hypothetical protein
VEDKQSYIAMKKTRVSAAKVTEFEYTAMSAEEIGQAIRKFVN